MRSILFCANPYAFGILKPIHDELTLQGKDALWYVPKKLLSGFPFKDQVKHTDSIKELQLFKSDSIFVPGNEVPHYLRGVKVQVFHGLAGEKAGHFRIRNYFDLYLTQGPYFTKRFEDLALKHRDFEVKETGWSKLDSLFQNHEAIRTERDTLLMRSGKKHLVLYAPTFSPSLTSTITKQNEIAELADQGDIFLLIKFHDLMDKQVVSSYKDLAAARKNVEVVEDRNILKYLIMADFMISDTSSVVYEFILLNKPVITINSKSENIKWRDINSTDNLRTAFVIESTNDSFKKYRDETIRAYHPYSDGKSSGRMIAAVEDYIARHGVPERRKLNLWRRLKINRMFGKEPL
jgi:CDP-ribitol ribitolphosphotransferase